MNPTSTTYKTTLKMLCSVSFKKKERRFLKGALATYLPTYQYYVILLNPNLKNVCAVKK